MLLSLFLSLVVGDGESWGRSGSARTFAKLMAPFLAPATARVERRLDRANMLGKLLLGFVDGARRWSDVNSAPNAWSR